jgi:DNA-binding transcriptional ArsR family regulator
LFGISSDNLLYFSYIGYTMKLPRKPNKRMEVLSALMNHDGITFGTIRRSGEKTGLMKEVGLSPRGLSLILKSLRHEHLVRKDEDGKWRAISGVGEAIASYDYLSFAANSSRNFLPLMSVACFDGRIPGANEFFTELELSDYEVAGHLEDLTEYLFDKWDQSHREIPMPQSLLIIPLGGYGREKYVHSLAERQGTLFKAKYPRLFQAKPTDKKIMKSNGPAPKL